MELCRKYNEHVVDLKGLDFWECMDLTLDEINIVRRINRTEGTLQVTLNGTTSGKCIIATHAVNMAIEYRKVNIVIITRNVAAKYIIERRIKVFPYKKIGREVYIEELNSKGIRFSNGSGIYVIVNNQDSSFNMIADYIYIDQIKLEEMNINNMMQRAINIVSLYTPRG